MQNKIKTITCENGNLEEIALPLLREKVFHVTSNTSYEGIIRDKMIKHNQNKDYEYSFGQSENSYGRHSGYICLFDLRNKSEQHIQNGLECFRFVDHPRKENKSIFLILSPKLYPKLIDWTQAQKEPKYEMYIPHIECWYPDSIPLESIDEIIEVIKPWKDNQDMDPLTQAIMDAGNKLIKSSKSF